MPGAGVIAEDTKAKGDLRYSLRSNPQALLRRKPMNEDEYYAGEFTDAELNCQADTQRWLTSAAGVRTPPSVRTCVHGLLGELGDPRLARRSICLPIFPIRFSAQQATYATFIKYCWLVERFIGQPPPRALAITM